MSAHAGAPLARRLTCAISVALAGCSSEAPVRVLSPDAEAVRVDQAEPPAGARLVGPITVTDGNGCGFGGERGTLAGATALLKEAARRRGIGFVKLVKITKPFSGHDCYHQEFELSGLGYRLPGNDSAPATRSAPAARGDAALQSALPVLTHAAPALNPPSVPAACSPPCSPGYVCHGAVCEAECNPACDEGHVCRADRVCVPG